MNSLSGGPSAFTKMKQAYWEAKQSFNKSVGQREDSHIISSDNELDIRLDLLQAADSSFNVLMKVILDYRHCLQTLVSIQENFGLALIEYGTKDSTAAGKVMCMSGKVLTKVAQRQSEIKTPLMNLFHEVQTFQYKATSDALQTVGKMEKVRRSYRSGLLWLKNESSDLDPDVSKKLRNFRKVQEHIKRLKVKFDGVKLESMQKIDLFLLSRSNLFSHTLVPYTKTFRKMCKVSALLINCTLKNIPLCLSYSFVALKDLNQYLKNLQPSFQNRKKLKKNKASEKKSTYISEELLNTVPLSAHSCISGKSNDDKHPPDETYMLSTDTLLIDLRENSGDSHSSSKVQPEEKNSTSSKYSDDLLLLNFDDYRPTVTNEIFTTNSVNKYLHSLTDFISEDIPATEKYDLEFWTLIQSHDHTPKLLETNNPEMKDLDLIDSKQSPSTSSVSKWNDILVQFDPFMDENSKLSCKTDVLELC